MRIALPPRDGFGREQQEQLDWRAGRRRQGHDRRDQEAQRARQQQADPHRHIGLAEAGDQHQDRRDPGEDQPPGPDLIGGRPRIHV